MPPIPDYVTFLRLIIPLSIFRWPLLGTLASAMMDVIDWSLIPFAKASDYIVYQNWDKAMDLYYLTFAFIMTYKWKDLVARRLAFIFFLWRMIGVIFFWSTKNHVFLFIFPNIFESFFIFYLLFAAIFKRDKLFTSWRVAGILTVVLVIPRLVNEYLLHVIQKQMWEVVNFGKILGLSGWYESLANFYAQGLILFIIPFLVGLVLINRVQKKGW